MKSVLTFLGKDAGFGENNNSAYLEIEDKFLLIDCRLLYFSKIKKYF